MEQHRRAPLRVGIIAPCPPPFGGITRMIENHVGFWKPDDVEAHFVPMYPPKDPKPVDGAAFHDLTSSTSRSLTGMKEYIRCYLSHPLTRPSVYKDYWRYNAALSSLIQELKLNVIYAHEVWPAGASAVLQSQIHGIASVVVTYGETWHSTPQYQRWSRIVPYVLGGAHRVISTSEHCRNGALGRGGDPARHSVIYAGIDLGRFRPDLDGNAFRARYGIPSDAFVIASLGLSLRRKLDTLLDALEGLAPGAGVHCIIGGAGPDSDYVAKRTAAISGIGIHKLGFVAEEELPNFYAATDVLVVSPRTLIECMGQSMKEAMACGRAVVGANIGGIPEAIRDGENGLLFRADDPADLGRALQHLVINRDLCKRLGAAGRSFAETKFDARVAAEETLHVFRAGLAAAGGECRGSSMRCKESGAMASRHP